jgi:hypothetical protein
MAHETLLVAVGMLLAPTPLAATQVETGPGMTAPAGVEGTRYCMRVDPITGSLVETIQCWTREEWAEQGVDVDKEWTREGVKVEPPLTA